MLPHEEYFLSKGGTMRSPKKRGARMPRLVLGVVVVAAVWLIVGCRPATAAPMRLAQPLVMSFSRNQAHVIVFLGPSPGFDYDAVEAFRRDRPGAPPLLRAILTRHDGFQIAYVNDLDFALEQQQTGSGQQVVYAPDLTFDVTELPGGLPQATFQFESLEGEHVVVDVPALFPSSTAQGGFTDPGNHDLTGSLPVMWREASTLGSTAGSVLVDGVPQAILPGPFPGSLSAFYTSGFHIGVIRRGQLSLSLVDAPNHADPGAAWTFVDSLGRTIRYEVISAEGDLVEIRKTTQNEEILLARRGPQRKDILEILRVRATGVPASLNATPPEPLGFTLDLTTPGQLALSIDGHTDLVTGGAATFRDEEQLEIVLSPAQPAWAVPRVVTATALFDTGGEVFLETTIAPE